MKHLGYSLTERKGTARNLEIKRLVAPGVEKPKSEGPTHADGQRLGRPTVVCWCDQLKKILVYICQAAAEGRQAEVSEWVLNRRNFDPNADTIVRVQNAPDQTRRTRYIPTLAQAAS